MNCKFNAQIQSRSSTSALTKTDCVWNVSTSTSLVSPRLLSEDLGIVHDTSNIILDTLFGVTAGDLRLISRHNLKQSRPSYKHPNKNVC